MALFHLSSLSVNVTFPTAQSKCYLSPLIFYLRLVYFLHSAYIVSIFIYLFAYHWSSLVECEFHETKESIFAAMYATYGCRGCVLHKCVALNGVHSQGFSGKWQ